MPRIDPLGEPAAYQKHLTSLVGSDDPAAVQAGTLTQLPPLVKAAGPHLRIRPAPAEWSVLELVGHLVDAEVMAAARYRWILAHDRPALAPFDQDLLASRLRHNEANADELLEFFQGVRRGNLALWRRLSPEERSRVGIHAERGPESCDLIFHLMAGHDRFHLAQMQRTLQAVTAAR
jgi:hypothetical protein